MTASAALQHRGATRTVIGSLLAALAVAVGAEAGAAQATLRGRVIDSEFGHPLAGAVVRINRDLAPLTTDTLGRFEAPALPAGDLDLTIEALGYARGVFTVRVPPSGRVDRTFALDFTGENLPQVVVEARAQQLLPRYLDFERRRERGLGAYFRWDQINRQGYQSVGDALRTVRGIRIRCNQQTFECFAYLARTPHCLPTWWVDGVQVSSFHENTPIRDVYGIEVYRGAGEVPAEYAGSTSGCGVIAVWTKSKPFR